MLDNQTLGSLLNVRRVKSSLYGQYLTSDVVASPPPRNFNVGVAHVCFGDDVPTGPWNCNVGKEMSQRRFFVLSTWLQGAARGRTTLKLGGGGHHASVGGKV